MPLGSALLKPASQDFEAGSLLLHPKSKCIGLRRSVRKVQKGLLRTARPFAGTLCNCEAIALKPILRSPRPAANRWPAKRFSILQALLSCCRRRRSPRLSWNPSVRVCSFSRRLGGGDAVPTDGTAIALGLGSLVEQSQAPLASCGALSDNISWMPAEQRETVLAVAMGSDRFARGQAQQGPELVQLLERRKVSQQDGKDVLLMPTSWQKARERAEQLSAEVATEPVEQRWADTTRPLCGFPLPISKPHYDYMDEQPWCGALPAKRKRTKKTKLTMTDSPSFLRKFCKPSVRTSRMLCRPGKARQAKLQMS